MTIHYLLPKPVAGAPDGTVTAPWTEPVGVGVVVDVGAVVVVGLTDVVGVVVGVAVCALATLTRSASPKTNAIPPNNRCLICVYSPPFAPRSLVRSGVFDP